MRNNQPITNREVAMKDGSMIVSTTDANGRIQFVNQDFIDISGFTKEELIGQPHNMIRHPDMPSEAFEDMWRDLKAGLPWSGYVKNRVKNGDHYWVHANAMPVVEAGQITGYISIRNKPNAAVVQQVAPIYQQFREGKAKGLSIEHGRVLSHARKARISRWFERLGSKVAVMGGALSALILLVGVTGLLVAHYTTQSMNTIYADRTVPAGQLAEIERHTYDSLVELYAISTSKEDPAPLIALIEKNMSENAKIWDAYMATYLTPEEAILAKEYVAKKDAMKEKILNPALEMLRANHVEGIAPLIVANNALTDEVAQANDKLIELQLRVAKEEFDNGVQDALIGRWVSVAMVLAALCVAFFSSKSVQRILRQRLTYLDTRLSSIAGGNFNTDVTIGNDELQNIMTTVKALQAKLAYNEFQKEELAKEKQEAQKQVANDFEKSVKGIVNVVAAAATELSQTAESMSSTVVQTAEKATDASGAARTTTANVQTVASAAEELSASVREISGQLQRTTQLVAQSKEKAHNADTVANALRNATDRVTSAMDMISSIAGQINLLALNATIESARAGDAGKGFAVVASEVKNLAGQTDKTASEIQAVVEEMRTASQAIIAALGEIGISVGSIAEATSSVASAVEEQSATTNEIARNMQHAAVGTQTISNNLQEVRDASASAGSASEQMLSASQELSKQAENLNRQVDDFLLRVRAA